MLNSSILWSSRSIAVPYNNIRINISSNKHRSCISANDRAVYRKLLDHLLLIISDGRCLSWASVLQLQMIKYPMKKKKKKIGSSWKNRIRAELRPPCSSYRPLQNLMLHVRNILTTMMLQWHFTSDLLVPLLMMQLAWKQQGPKGTTEPPVSVATSWPSQLLMRNPQRVLIITSLRGWGGCYLKDSIGFPPRPKFWSDLRSSPVMFAARPSTVTIICRFVFNQGSLFDPGCF